MLGTRFCPRIRGIAKQRIYHADPGLDYGPLRAMLAPREQPGQAGVDRGAVGRDCPPRRVVRLWAYNRLGRHETPRELRRGQSPLPRHAGTRPRRLAGFSATDVVGELSASDLGGPHLLANPRDQTGDRGGARGGAARGAAGSAFEMPWAAPSGQRKRTIRGVYGPGTWVPLLTGNMGDSLP